MIQEEVCSEEDDDAFDTCSEAASSCPQSPLVTPRQNRSSGGHQQPSDFAVGVDEKAVSSDVTVEVEPPPSSTSSSSSDDDDEYEAFRINR